MRSEITKHAARPWLYREGRRPLWFPLDNALKVEALAACASDPDQCRQTLALLGRGDPALGAVLRDWLDDPEDAAGVADDLWELAQRLYDHEPSPWPQESDEPDIVVAE